MASLLENTSRIANAKEQIKTSIIKHGVEIETASKIDSYSSKIDFMLNIVNEDQFCYMFKNGRFLNQFDNVISQCNAEVKDCTGMFHNICLKDTSYRTYDFNNLNLSKCTNFYDCFTGGADWWTIRGDIINFDMSSADNCSYAFNTCTYLDKLTFKSGASFGGKSDSGSLTLDLSQTNLSADAISLMINSISNNENGKTRIIKIKENIYDELSDETIDTANSKGYDLSM